MNQTAMALVVGLLAGVAGAVVVGFVADDGTTVAAVRSPADLSGIVQRLERIEAALDREDALQPGELRGDGTADSLAARQAAEARLDRLVAKLEERLRPVVKESVDSSVKAAIKEAGGGIDLAALQEPKRKEMTLAEAAIELELTAEEEQAVREITKETTDAFLKLLVDENATIDDVRREFEEAKDNPAKKIELASKYMGKAMGNLGGMIGVMMTHESKMTKALGSEKKRKLESGYKITDLDPYGLEEMFDFD